MPKFRNVSGADLHLFGPGGQMGTYLVEAGEIANVMGELVTSRPTPKKDEPEPTPLPDDAYIVRSGDEEKAWPHAVWELVDEKTDEKPEKAKPTAKEA